MGHLRLVGAPPEAVEVVEREAGEDPLGLVLLTVAAFMRLAIIGASANSTTVVTPLLLNLEIIVGACSSACAASLLS